MSDIDPIALARLQRAFDRLPTRHAAIFSAVRHDGMTYAEIADKVGITPLHVERLVADALYRLVCDVDEQERGIAPSPITRFIRDRYRNLRLWPDFGATVMMRPPSPPRPGRSRPAS